MPQPRLPDGYPVHGCSIAAIKIPYLITGVIPAERAMAARQGRIADGEQIGWVASNVHLSAWERKSRVFEGAGNRQKPWVHFNSLLRAILCNTLSRDSQNYLRAFHYPNR